MKKIKQFTFFIVFAMALCSCKHVNEIEQSKSLNWNDEIIYHVMQRSFYDSNGDLHGDLDGFVQKLDYLKELGVTTILFTPLYESDFYHNYFPINYEKIDPEYGTKEDYLNFVKAVHAHGMKFLMDMETQYAQSGNKWFDDSYKNPASPYSEFIYYTDSLNLFPEQIFLPSKSPLYEFSGWPGPTHNIVYLDLNNEVVKKWMKDFYISWVDPNADGQFDDGVDGFRIDHIMDNLDSKNIFINMYNDFWNPIFSACKSINPNLFILGEQSDWNEYGEKMVMESGADAAFSFPLRFAIAGEEGTNDMFKAPVSTGVKMDPGRIHKQVLETMKRFDKGTYSITFLENHDTDRWASVVNRNQGQMRIGAVLNLLLPGVPSIYYGQELGLTGQTHEWKSDANHIPVREAFPWTSNSNDPGNAIFYKNTGEWWDISFWNNESIKDLSLSTQKNNPTSLWSHYQRLISLRKKYIPFRQGNYLPVTLEDQRLMAFTREFKNEIYLVVLNVSAETIQLDSELLASWKKNLLAEDTKLTNTTLQLEPYQFIILTK
jgi:alpha-amylase